MSAKIRTGIIGFGISGSAFHAPFIYADPRFQLTKISTGKQHSASLIRERYPGTQVTDKPAAINGDPDIDLVIITAPNLLHFPLAHDALSAGKHVVLEKPFTLSTIEADELIALAEKKQKVLTVYHNRRWDSDFKTVRKLIAEDRLGRISEYEAHFDRFRPALKQGWRESAEAGSGILYDLGPHLIDQALVLFGKPLSVEADIQVQREGALADDYFRLILSYLGLEVRLVAGMLQKEPTPRFDIRGTKGHFIKYGLDVQESALKAGISPNTENWGIEPPEIWGELKTGADGLRIPSEAGRYQDFFANLYDAILGIQAIAVDPRSARDVIEMIEKARISSAQQEPIAY